MKIIINANFFGGRVYCCSYDDCENDCYCYSYSNNNCDSACGFDSTDGECTHDGLNDNEGEYRGNICSDAA